MPSRRQSSAMLDFVTQAVQNDADILFGRLAFAGCPADVLHQPLGRRFRVLGFLSHLHSLMVTMSQKSSVPQAIKSVSQALMSDNPRVLVAGLDLPAKVLKEGSFETTDLALLSVDKERLPVSLRLRRNPLCKEPPQAGTNVVIVYPTRTVRSRIISPFTIPPQYQAKFGGALINEAEGSGSGVFQADKRCLLGIISSKITKFKYRKVNKRLLVANDGFAGHFVPAPAIAEFIPPEFRF